MDRTPLSQAAFLTGSATVGVTTAVSQGVRGASLGGQADFKLEDLMERVGKWLAVCLVALLTGILPLRAAQPGDKLWEFQTRKDGYANRGVDSSPAIAQDGTVYAGAAFSTCNQKFCVCVGMVYALNGVTGQQLWEKETAYEVHSSPAIGASGTLYVASFCTPNGPWGKACALDGTTGEELWASGFDIDLFTSSSAAIAWDGTVYLAGTSKIYALRGGLPENLWGSNPGPSYWTYSSPGLGADGTLYAGSYDGRIYALNGVTGQKVWFYQTGDQVRSSPAVAADGTLYVGSNDRKVYALNGATGEKRWEFLTEGGVCSSPAIGMDGTVFIGSNDGKIYALEGSTGGMIWAFQTGGSVQSSAAIGADGTVYVGSDDHKLYAFEGATGRQLWEFPTGGWVRSSPTIGADGTVYVGSGDGKVYALVSRSVGGLARSPWPKFRHDAQNTGRYASPPTAVAEHSGPVVLKQHQEGRLSVQITGGPLPRVQWFFNGAPLPGRTNAMLILPLVERGLEGIYWLIASNALGQATSAPIIAVVSNVDPQRFLTLRWPGQADPGVSLEFADQVGAGAVWHTVSNYPPAAAEQGFVGPTTVEEGFYRLAGSATPPALTMASWATGWEFSTPAGRKYSIQYTAASQGWTNWLTLTNLVLPTSPYLFLDDTSSGDPSRVYRITPVP